MSTELTNPLSDIIKKATQLPDKGRASALKQRFVNASSEIVVVADCSGSMVDSIGGLRMSKYRQLEIALDDVMKTHPHVKVIAFGSTAHVITGRKRMPGPNLGGTDLARALKLAGTFHPAKTIIISDGLPDNAAEALNEVAQITGEVDTIYCGPDSDPAIDFLRSLSRAGGGVHVTWDGMRNKELAPVVRLMLPAPVKG